MRVRPASPVVLLASSRPEGNTFALARLVLPEESAPLINLNALHISYYSYSNENAADDFLPLMEELVTSPLWVLATPLYWYTMSAQAKTFLDRLSDLLSFRKSLGHQLRGKCLAVLCSGTDEQPPLSFEEPFALTARYLGMGYAGCLYGQFEGNRMVRPDIAVSCRVFGEALVEEASNLSIGRTASSQLRWPPLYAAKQVLATNEKVRYGIFGQIGASGYFPPREFLNEFLMKGMDPCDQDGRMSPWRPFAVTPEEYRDLKEWWIARHSGAIEDGLGADNWDDWVQEILDP